MAVILLNGTTVIARFATATARAESPTVPPFDRIENTPRQCLVNSGQWASSGKPAAFLASPYTDLISRYSSSPNTPIERPMPDCL